MIIFPVSPLPAGLNRQVDWGEQTTSYDSGRYQAVTPYLRPMYNLAVPFRNFTEVKQGQIFTFINSQKNGTMPFLMKDPYDYRVNSVLAVRSGYASGSGNLYLFDTNSFFVRADTTTVASLFSVLSGYVRLGLEYSYDQDTGTFTVNTKAQADVWGIRSMQYFRKWVFDGKYNEEATLWNIFNVNLRFKEIL